MAEVIRPTGFFRVKARSVVGLARELVTRFGGAVPATMADQAAARRRAEDRERRPGESARVPGLPVDTHALRVAGRLGLTAAEDPGAVETDLTALFEP